MSLPPSPPKTSRPKKFLSKHYWKPVYGPKSLHVTSLSEVALKFLTPVFERYGFNDPNIILNWAEIVGPRMARLTEPVKISWSTYKPQTITEQKRALAAFQDLNGVFGAAGGVFDEPHRSATLIVRVQPGFQIYLQHDTSVLLEKINAHLGWRCIVNLKFQDGEVIQSSRSSVLSAAEPSPVALQHAQELTKDVEDEELQALLTRLSAHVLER